MAYDQELADRIREALSTQRQVREVRMFGALAFMVNGSMAVTADADGRLMVRCDPDRAEKLLEREGADWAEMRGKPMGKGWIVVADHGIESDEAFDGWMTEALDYNRKVSGSDD
ncbi:TfoX/Sxy family protein [Streptomyces coeruleorubidus]|uniref:TfoX/Sxy family protein n=1 Tax=Streptomyces coeruleorubidus TaxID=116188 RepID=UPI00237FCDF4|nr:TfoX/Sxy family protein [Streptomyces coeruleorubidus]WDV49692.1 TfoX/Sxy family protein [Streptomyces coeruleorubidus]